MPKQAKGIFIGVGICLIVAAAVFVYAKYDPSSSQYFPKCPFRLLTGLECPGCGSQRAIHHLLELDIKAALQSNVLAVLSIPYLLAACIIWTVQHSTRKPSARNIAQRAELLLFHGPATRVVLVTVIVFWIARNFTDAF